MFIVIDREWSANTDQDTANCLSSLSLQLTRSQVMGSRGGGSEISTTRTSKTGWLKDTDHPTVAALTRRVSLVTGLAADTDQEDAELLQVANYMNGGHYNPHSDYVMKEKDPQHVSSIIRVSSSIVIINVIVNGIVYVIFNIIFIIVIIIIILSSTSMSSSSSSPFSSSSSSPS